MQLGQNWKEAGEVNVGRKSSTKSTRKTSSKSGENRTHLTAMGLAGNLRSLMEGKVLKWVLCSVSSCGSKSLGDREKGLGTITNSVHIPSVTPYSLVYAPTFALIFSLKGLK